jgi:pilus assembly protein Flp/PilA
VKTTTAATPHQQPALPDGGASSGEEIMFNLINFVKSFSSTEEGQDLLEYALLVALIALVAVGAVTAAGGSVSAIFTAIGDRLTAAAAAA